MRTLNRPLRDWAGRRVWIIGASSGIGASLARALADLGARVALSARRRDLLESLAAELPPTQALVVPFDLTQAGAAAATEQEVVSRWAGYDLVVVMAGDYAPLDAWHFDGARADALIDVNLRGPLYALEAILPRLRAQGHGAVALVASVAGYRGLPKSLVYGPTKAALINLAESLYLDLHPHGLGVFLVNPGFVRTPLTAQNDFEMPALISADAAAREMIAGFARGAFEIHFPRRFTRVVKALRFLPYRWYFPLIARRTGS